MYEPAAVGRLAALIHSGLLDLDQFAVTTFPLDCATEAVAHAAANPEGFKLTAIVP